MEWLIIKSDKRTDAVSPVEEFLLKREQKFSVLCREDIKALHSGKRLKTVFKNFTHVIITDEDFCRLPVADSLLSGMQFFLLGEIAGRNLPLYCVNLPHLTKLDDSILNFSSVKEAVDFLDREYAQIEKEDIRRIATDELLSKGIPVTPECFASFIVKDKLPVCRLFIKAGVDVNSRDPTGTPMLNVAVRSENKKIVSWLISENADINLCSHDRGYSAVMDAVWKSNESIIKLLVAAGADLNCLSKDGQSILVLAVGIGKENICRILAEGGADPDIKDSMGMSAYEYAVLFKNEKIVKVLAPFHKESD
ncbi:ankyrin repeat domain-containing protein [Treponema parvum]|uniref:Ankyrin repeat domain-containing protein n=1 Tax=Treponema parvum TaxID=138851 RepID=A0A975F0N6_9SPIR|nr:ankyrin repeat domain-containing protein [Treponema parvum]QTQ11919.1 ankyrin repeat domain-containing protein [Treponema parvum]QTQ16105.1 ankyrin repeat domain-containing protein [Treponema parvum]